MASNKDRLRRRRERDRLRRQAETATEREARSVTNVNYSCEPRETTAEVI